MMYAAYNVFNNEKTIRESLDSVVPFVEKVIAVDGAYRRFPYEKPYSTDATKQIFLELCGSKLEWVDTRKAWKSQVAKKNALLKRIPTDQWFLRLAADEVIRGKIAQAFSFAEASNFRNIGVRIENFHPVWKGYSVRQKKGHACVYLARKIPREVWSKLKWKAYFGIGNRIVLKQEGLHFEGHHSCMRIGRKLTRVQTSLADILIINMPFKIGWKRWHQKIAYKRKRYELNDFEA